MVTWLVIANSTSASIYDITKPEYPGAQHDSHYKLVTELSHEKSRLKTSELVDDKPGHYQGSGSSRGAYSSHTDAHENEIQFFAKDIAHYLETAREKNSFKQLILCAGPHFHGLLNHALSKQTALLVKKHIEKDYIPLSDKKLHDVIETIYKMPL
jgi:protein required for attachment to host cells